MKVVSRVARLDFTGCETTDEISLTFDAAASQSVSCAAHYILLPASTTSVLASIASYANTTNTITITTEMNYETVVTMLMVKFTPITI
jgi:heat shock protein HslJ